MTLLFFDSFQNCQVYQKPEWDPSNTWGTGEYLSSGRDGLANGSGCPAGNNHSKLKTLTIPGGGAATMYCGFAIHTGNNSGLFGATGSGFIWGIICAGSANVQLSLGLDASGYMQLRLGDVGGSVIATATEVPLGLNAWYHIQIKAVCHTSAGSVEIRVNDAPVIIYSGQTSTVNGAVTALRIRTYAGTVSKSWLVYDDLWVCDAVDASASQGRPNNGFLGDLRVAALLPTSDGAAAAWTPSTGTNHSALVDENPPNQTDYVSSSTPGQQDLYNVTDVPATTTAVYGVRASFYAAKTDAGVSSVKPLIREPNGTITADAAAALSTTWLGYYGEQRFVKPNAGGVWSPADANAIQVGVELA